MARRKTHEEFCEEVYLLVGNEYKILSQYINQSTYIQMQHITCDNKWEIRPNNFLNGCRCPICAKLKVQTFHTKTNEDFLSELYLKTNNTIIALEKYGGCETKILFKHNDPECGYEWFTSPSSLLNNDANCPKCIGLVKKTTQEYIKAVETMHNDEYMVLGEYINARTKIKIKHNLCNNEWDIIPRRLLLDRGCPFCKQSKGEKEVSNILNVNNIIYQTQYKFNDRINVRKLPFDFAILGENNYLICLIEYDGLQHFLDKPTFGKHNHYKEITLRDSIKNEYCTKNNIKLIRIPYWDFDNIESILQKELIL